jgi:hypothetical protein
MGSFLLVYLHSPENPACDLFVDGVLRHDEIHRMVGSGELLLYGACVDGPEGLRLAGQFHAQAFPWATIFLKKQVIFRLQGYDLRSGVASSALGAVYRAAIKKAMSDWGTLQAETMAMRIEAEENYQRLREEESELARLMKEDEERLRRFDEQERQRQAELQRRQHHQQQPQREIVKKDSVAEEVSSKAAVSLLPDPPNEAVPKDHVAVICFRGMSGTTVERRFFLTNKVKDLYSFARTMPDYDGRTPFKLYCGFPRAVVEETDDEIGSVASLHPSSCVFVRSC